ncbi:MAG: hypothetical protein RLZ82_98 [Actinomycetota bacterium]|jgi:hypothetical protein
MKTKHGLIGLLSVFLLAGCSSNVGGAFSEFSQNDLQACEDFYYTTNPYDGANESLWDYDAFDSYKSDVENAFWYADHEDLIYYSDELANHVGDVLDELDYESSKEDVEYEAEDIDSAVYDLEHACSLVTG